MSQKSINHVLAEWLQKRGTLSLELIIETDFETDFDEIKAIKVANDERVGFEGLTYEIGAFTSSLDSVELVIDHMEQGEITAYALALENAVLEIGGTISHYLTTLATASALMRCEALIVALELETA